MYQKSKLTMLLKASNHATSRAKGLFQTFAESQIYFITYFSERAKIA